MFYANGEDIIKNDFFFKYTIINFLILIDPRILKKITFAFHGKYVTCYNKFKLLYNFRIVTVRTQFVMIPNSYWVRTLKAQTINL